MPSNSPADRGALGGATIKDTTFTTVFTVLYGADALHDDPQQELGILVPQSVELSTPQHFS